MGKIYKPTLLIFVALALMNVSCTERFLDQNPTSAVIKYYQNIDELEAGLVTCYASLRFTGFDNTDWAFGDVGSDDADKGSDKTDQPGLESISLSRQNASTDWVSQPWWSYYTIINKCNLVIDNSSGTQGDDTAAIEKIVNQAKFLRGLCFYHLVTLYGDVPLVNRYLSPDELILGRAPADSIWKQIESDLTDATNLPSIAESGRVTSGAAYSLLGKVYLTQGKHLQANAAFSKVVSSGVYQLLPDFGSIFRHEGENSSESIFEIQTKSDIPSGGPMGTSSVIFRLPRDQGGAIGWGFDAPTADLFREFEDGDPRIIYTFMFKGDIFPYGTDTYTVGNYSSPSGYQARKVWVPWSERVGLEWWEWDYNYRYMRYAEVLLLYAESLNEVNKPDSARMLVNMVRNRARDTPTTDPQRIYCAYPLSHPNPLLADVTTSNQSDLRQAIWHELRVELAIEGHRRNFLMRTKLFKIQMEAAKGDEGCTVEPFELLLPIPQREIELSNYVLTQNPGY